MRQWVMADRYWRRRRASHAVAAPTPLEPSSVAGLWLWFNGESLRKAWYVACAYGIDVQRVNAGGSYVANGSILHRWMVVPWRNGEGGKEFVTWSPTTWMWGDNYDGLTYRLDLTWGAAAGADGYRVFKVAGSSYDRYVDVTGCAFSDTGWAAWNVGSAMTPVGQDVPANGNACRFWPGSGAYGGDGFFEQVTNSYMPVFIAGGAKGGLGCARFDGVNDGMFGLNDVTVPFTMFIVMKDSGPASYEGRLVQGAASVGANWYAGVNVGKYAVYDGEAIIDGSATQEGVWVVQTVVQTCAECRHYVNGTLVGSRTGTNGEPGVVALGSSGLYSAPIFKGDVAAILVYGAALSDANRSGVEEWLKALYVG